MRNQTIGDAHEGTQEEWDAWIAAWRKHHQQQPRNRKLGPNKEGQGDGFEIEDEGQVQA